MGDSRLPYSSRAGAESPSASSSPSFSISHSLDFTTDVLEHIGRHVPALEHEKQRDPADYAMSVSGGSALFNENGRRR
jgi:hypothetical protein